MTTWNDPRTWLAGEEPPAAVLNAHIRDNFRVLSEAFTGGTATFSATGGGFALGNGTVTASFSTAGPKRALGKIKLTLGSTTSFGSGKLQITMGGGFPLGISLDPAGWAIYNDQSASVRYGGAVFWATSTVLELAGPTGAITATAPFTWATGDWIAIGLSWEAP